MSNSLGRRPLFWLILLVFVLAGVFVWSQRGDQDVAFEDEPAVVDGFVIRQIEGEDVVREYSDRFAPEYEVKSYLLSASSEVVVEIEHGGELFADVERVSLEACGEAAELREATLMPVQRDVLETLREDDLWVTVVGGKQVRLVWDVSSDCSGDLELFVHANEHGPSEPFNSQDDGFLFEYEMGSERRDITLDGDLAETDGLVAPHESLYWVPGTGHPPGEVWITVSEMDEGVVFSFDLTIDNTDEEGQDWIEVVLYDAETKSRQSFRVDDENDAYGACAFGMTSMADYPHQTCEVMVPREALEGERFSYYVRYYGTAAPTGSSTGPLIPPLDGYFGELLATFSDAGTTTPAFLETDGSPRDFLTAGNPDSTPDVAMFMAYNGLNTFHGVGRERSISSNGYDLFVVVQDAVGDAITWTSALLSASGNCSGGCPYGFSQIQNLVPDYNDEGVYVLWEDGAEGGPIPSPSGATHLAHLNDNTGAIDWQVDFEWQSAVMVEDGSGGIFVLRDSGPEFDGSGSTSVGILERYTSSGQDLTFGGTGSVVVSNDAISDKGGATLVSYLDSGFNYDVFVIWADDDATNPGIYARRFDETGSAHASFTDARGTLVVSVPQWDVDYFTDFPGIHQIQAKGNPVISEDNVVGAALIDGELAAFSFDGDGNNLYACEYNPISSSVDQFDVVMQYGISGGPKGVFVFWQDGNDLNSALMTEDGHHYWTVGGNTIATDASLTVTLKSPQFQSNVRGRYEGSSAGIDTSTAGGYLIYGDSSTDFTEVFFDDSLFFAGPANDCVAGATPPDAIIDLVATAGVSEVGLTWSAPADNGDPITDYVIEFREFPGGVFGTFADGVSTATSATVTGLTNGQEYEFRVFAVNGGGNSAASNLDTAIPQALAGGRSRTSSIGGPQFFLGKLSEFFSGEEGVSESDDEQSMADGLRSSAGSSGSGRPFGSLDPVELSLRDQLPGSDRRFSDAAMYPEFLGGGNRAQILSLLDLVIALRKTFAWSYNPVNYELLRMYEPLAQQYHRFFRTRLFHRLVGVEYLRRGQIDAYEFDYREALSAPTDIVVFMMRSVLLTFGKSCYSDELLNYAEEVDYPGSEFWFERYVEIMKPWMDEVLKTRSYVMWRSVQDVNMLDALYLFLYGFCFDASN